MTGQKKSDKQDAINKAEGIRKLVLERELALKKIKENEDETLKLKKRNDDIEIQLNSLLSFQRTESSSRDTLGNKTLPKPKRGIVKWMAEVMSEDRPMTKEEIVDAIKKNGHDVEINSVRSYLSNMDCFENIQISGPEFAKYNKKGWLCHKDKLG